MRGLDTKITHLANQVVRVTGSLIFAWLTWYSLRYTHYMPMELNDVTVVLGDSLIVNVLFCALALAFMGAISRLGNRLSVKCQTLICRVLAAVSCIWVVAAGFKWIYSATRYPVNDQVYVYAAASMFIEGQYDFLAKGGYCDVYPHQLGLVFFMELFFRIFGAYQYFRYEIFCVFLTGGIVYLGYRILRELEGSLTGTVIYCVSMMCCVPLIVYTSWVYNEIPCLFFTMLMLWCLLRYERTRKLPWLVAVVFLSGIAYIIRKNTIILIIALLLAGGVRFIQKKDKRLLICLLSLVTLCALSYPSIYKMYEIRSGIEHSQGLPIKAWFALGLSDEEGRYGRYINDFTQHYYQNGYDVDLVKEKIDEWMTERTHAMLSDPGTSAVFFREKLLQQWNDPLYGSIYLTAQYRDTEIPPADSWIAGVTSTDYIPILKFSSLIQLLIYTGMFLYYALAVSKGSTITNHVAAITIIGGFLFSIIWEAKSRYIFSYYPLMFPLAAAGYCALLRKIAAWLSKLKK